MSDDTPSGVAPRSPLRIAGGVLLRIWLAFHLFAIVSWSIPPAPRAVMNGRQEPRLPEYLLLWNDRYARPSPLNGFQQSAVSHYLLFTGFWQVWDMFAPDPATVDLWCDAVVQFKNGEIVRYQYSRMYLLSPFEKYFKERYRKYYERATEPGWAFLWPQFAQRIALECHRDSANPPVKVWLRRHLMMLGGPNKPIPKDYSIEPYFEYDVDQTQLARDRGR